jgi:hypothetical protein
MLVRLVPVFVLAVLTSAPLLAQQATKPADGSPPQLPVSLDHIRAALERSPVERLKIVEHNADFRVVITERQRWQDLLATLDFRSGPVPPGGLYAYEQRMRNSPQWASQPIFSFDMLPLVRWLGGAISDAKRSRAEGKARVEVSRAIAEWCDAQPDHGAGIYICKSPDIR